MSGSKRTLPPSRRTRTASYSRHEIGAVIAHRRAELGLTQRDIGNRLGSDHSYVSHVENGNRIPGYNAIEKIAAALGLEARIVFVRRSDRA